MTVALDDRVSGPYDCTGGETLLPYGFRLVSEADLAVWRRRGGGIAKLVLNIDYTIDGVGNANGGNVTLASAALDGDAYLVEGERPNRRTQDLVGERAWKAQALNAEWDSLQIQIQELSSRVARSLKRSGFDDSGGDNELPLDVGYLFLDSDGNLTVVPSGGGGGGGLTLPLGVEQGGTGADDPGEARSNLGLGALATKSLVGFVDCSNGVVRFDVESRAIATPPVSPTTGQMWIIPAGATGAWDSKTGQIARWSGSAWAYIAPGGGWTAYDKTSQDHLAYAPGTGWRAIGAVVADPSGLVQNTLSNDKVDFAIQYNPVAQRTERVLWEDVGFTQAGTNAVRRKLISKIRDHVDILDYLSDSQAAQAVAGTLDMTVILQRLLNELPNNKGTVTFKRPGNYLFQKQAGNAFGVTIGSNRRIVFETGVRLKTEGLAVGVNGFSAIGALFRNNTMTGNGNENIIIEGGEFQVNAASASYGGSAFFAFKNVAGLRLIGQRCLDTVGSCRMQLANCRDFFISEYAAHYTGEVALIRQSIQPTSVYEFGDALRMGSGCRNGVVRSVRLDSGDDAIALNNEPSETDGLTSGLHIRDIEITDAVVSTQRGHALRVYQEATMVSGNVFNISVKGLRGTVAHVAVNAGISLADYANAGAGRNSIYDCSFTNVQLDVAGVVGDGVLLYNTDNIKFSNLQLTGYKYWGVNAYNAKRASIDHPTFAGGAGSQDGIGFFNGSHGGRVTGGYMVGAGRDNIQINGSNDCVIEGVRFEAPGRSNIYITGATGTYLGPNRHISTGTGAAVLETGSSNYTVCQFQDTRGCATGVDTQFKGAQSLYLFSLNGSFFPSAFSLATVLLNNNGLQVKDGTGNFSLTMVPGSNFTANRTLTIVTGDANRTLDLTAPFALAGANTDLTSIALGNTGLKVKDTDASHMLSIVPNSNLSANRTLTVTTGDADRTLDLTTPFALAGANTDLTSIALGNTGLKVKDTDASHTLSIVPNSNLSANRTLTVTTGDADRTLDLTTPLARAGANTDITSIALNNSGLTLRDTDASHNLTIRPGSNLSANRVLTVTTGDADRTLDLTTPFALAGNNTDITGVALANTGLTVKDTDASHLLSIVPGSNLTANRTLTVITGDQNTTLDLSGGGIAVNVLLPRNRAINGGFTVDQIGEGAEKTIADNGRFADVHTYLGEASAALTARATTAVANGISRNGQIRFTGSADKGGVLHKIRGINCRDMRGKTVTFSMNLSVSNARLGDIRMAILQWTGTEDAISADPISTWGAEGANPSLIANWAFANTPTNLSVTTSIARYSVSATISGSMNNLALLWWSNDKSYTANDTLYFSQLLCEVAASASPYEERSYETELDACQTYIQVYGGDSIYEFFTAGYANNSNTGYFPMNLVKEMRVPPSLTVSAISDFVIGRHSGGADTATGIAIGQASRKKPYVVVNVAGAPLGAGDAISFQANNSLAARLYFDAGL